MFLRHEGSAAASLFGWESCWRWTGSPKAGFQRKQICALCAELEGHPDNAAAALFGGFTIVTKTINRVARFDVDPALKFVLFIPNFEVKTSDARMVVPASFSRQEVVENLGNASLIAAAFASRRIRIFA